MHAVEELDDYSVNVLTMSHCPLSPLSQGQKAFFGFGLLYARVARQGSVDDPPIMDKLRPGVFRG